MTDVQQLSKDFADLKTALQELGVVGNAYGKTAGVLEKQQGKLQSAFKKNPIVQFGKSLMGMGKQVRLFNKLQTQSTQLTDEQRAEVEKNATGLTKWMVSVVGATAYGKYMNKMVEEQASLWRRLTMNIFGILSIFLLVGFAIAAVSLAFQGAESPLLDYTDGIPFLDQAMQGLVLAFTGEGEGGFLGALNLVTAALVLALPVWFLFGAPAALLAAGLLLVVGTYQLVKKHTGSAEAALAAAAVAGMVLVGVFILMKLWLGGTALTISALSSTFMGALGLALLAVGLVVGGIVGIWMVLTGKINGWMAWVVTAISAVAIACGLAIIFGFGIVPLAIIALVIFVVVMVIKYWDEIWAFLCIAGTWILDGLIWAGEWIVAFIAGIILTVIIAVEVVIGVIILVGGAIIGIITFPFVFIWNFVSKLWTSFQKARKKGWRGIVAWVMGIPAMFKRVAADTIKGIINKVIKAYNWFAKKMTIKIPKWVPKIGGKKFGLPRIPKLAKGGIVNNPTIAMIGEDGPEAVIPLTKKNNPQGIGLGGGNRGPITININASGITDRTDKRALAREIGEAIREEMNRGGRGYGNRRGAL
jgi:hypothetical protein